MKIKNKKKQIKKQIKRYKLNKFKKIKIKKLINIYKKNNNKKKNDLYKIISYIDKCYKIFHKNKINRLKKKMYIYFNN
ncbi:MAG: 30S ribosomal protein S20 [Candidatus Shikimatogenerans sp. Tcar]|uniref:30S ribosomal protein S20 n=1 Tax=Candidatus Shikimatogenerans sp. Tcar TaxID=3158565 RepID=A0AAU7QRU1_9FLAO